MRTRRGTGTLLIRLTIFLLPIALLVWWLDTRLELIPNNYSAKLGIESRLADAEVLITGSSHEFFGVDPALLSVPAYNLANSSQTLYYDVGLVRHYMDRMPKLKLVVIGLSLFSFEMQLHDTPEAWRSHFYYRYFGIPTDDGEPAYGDLRNFSLLALYGPQTSFGYLSGISQLPDTVNAYGWGEARTENFRFTEQDGARRAALHLTLMHTKYIPQTVGALDAMITDLRKRGIGVALMMSPVYRTYSDHVDPVAYARTDSIIRSIVDRHHVRYHDYFRDPRFTIEDFANHDHLNRQGAVKMAAIVQAEVIDPELRGK